MTITAVTLTTFAQKGLREQLSDTIYNISPEDTPVTSMAAKTKAKGVTNEWLTDTLQAVDTSNAQLEGDDITTYPTTPQPARVSNVQQISRKLLAVSGTAEEVEKAGRKSEINYQTAARGAEMKNDIEAIIMANQAGNAGSATVARTTATLGAWMKTNVVKASDGVTPGYGSVMPTVTRTDGTKAAFTETMLKTAIQALWTAGGKCKYLFVGPYNKGVVSGFAGLATKTYNLNAPKPATIVATVDTYVGEFGTLDILPHRLMRERDAYLLDPNYIEIQHLRPFRRKDLAESGDASKVMLIVEWGLKIKQEAGLAAIYDLTTSA
jgi:hypothetical protein